ncbi:hypothetical protein INR49_011427, partial [Caranx melampygus]
CIDAKPTSSKTDAAFDDGRNKKTSDPTSSAHDCGGVVGDRWRYGDEVKREVEDWDCEDSGAGLRSRTQLRKRQRSPSYEANFLKMASWGKVATAAARTLLRLPRALRSPALRRSVGPALVGSAVGAGAFCLYNYTADSRSLPFAVHAEEQKSPAQEAPAPQMSARKVRFIKFASMVYEQEAYMTPRDFLYSVMLENVDRKLQKKTLTTEEVNAMLTTASKARAGNDLFRTLGDKGLISYTEYLFLLTILTSKSPKPAQTLHELPPALSNSVLNGERSDNDPCFAIAEPHTGFHIAFQMLDVDGNEQVDKKEFLKKPIVEGEGVNTSLQAYFFGKKGQNKLKYKEFHRFMEDLQAEVQEMEFLQFSKGMDTMRREDFAEWLLHYTNEEDNEMYWENMRKKIPAGQSITFDEFRAFCLFTNNLEDFAFSMSMVTEANRPVGMVQACSEDRHRHDLSENVLDTVFKLFDMDGDNCLSHKEFISVMHDRVLRGLKVQPQNGFSGFWKCVKQETLKGAQEALGDSGTPI